MNDLRWELFTLLSHGGFVTIVDKTAFDGWLDPVAYERFGAAFREVHEKREHFGYNPLREVAFNFSSRTRDWYGRESPVDYFQSFLGAHKAMVYEHIPLGVVLNENVTAETLKSYPVLILPSAAIVSDKEVELFRRYVEEGGNLIITALSGSRGWRGEQLAATKPRNLPLLHSASVELASAERTTGSYHTTQLTAAAQCFRRACLGGANNWQLPYHATAWRTNDRPAGGNTFD